MTVKELDKISKNAKIKYCYIKKGTYYRPGSCGYTDYQTRAGVYPKAVAIEHALSCRELLLIPVNIADHNKTIMDNVRDLLSRYLD